MKNGLPSALSRMSRATGSRAGCLGQEPVDEREAIPGVERPERDLGGEGAIEPWRAVTGPIRRQQQDGGAAQPLDERGKIRLRRVVDPVEVLDENGQRPVSGHGEHEGAQRLDRACADLLRTQLAEALLRVLDAEKVEQIGGVVARGQAETLERCLHARRHLVRRIGVADAADRAHDVEQGQVGNVRAVGETPALEERDAPVREAYAKLQHQPRLPRARLPHHAHRLAAPSGGLRKRVGKRGELALPPHEAAQRASDTPVQRGARAPHARSARAPPSARFGRGSPWGRAIPGGRSPPPAWRWCRSREWRRARRPAGAGPPGARCLPPRCNPCGGCRR